MTILALPCYLVSASPPSQTIGALASFTSSTSYSEGLDALSQIGAGTLVEPCEDTALWQDDEVSEDVGWERGGNYAALAGCQRSPM